MKKRPVNLGRSDENIADQYLNIFEGLQKDAAQNSWDAKTTKKGKNWKLAFRYIHERNILMIEDYGTVGMDKERWIRYQSLWDTEKAESEHLGARGQGKFLFHYFSTDKLVLTETIDKDGVYRFSYGTSEEWDDESKRLEDFIPGAQTLNHQGTRIWIMNVKKELLDELLDYKTFMRYISATWWEIIRNWGSEFIVNFDGVDRKVELPEYPQVRKERKYQNDKIRDLGRVRNYILRHCEEEVPEYLRGVAVQRGGMTILRLSVSADESIKNRIYGYCDFDDAMEAELKRVENPNHFGFSNKRAWNYTREYLRRKLDDFIQEISPKKRTVEIDQDLINEAVKMINNLINEYAPELTPEVTGLGGVRPPKPPKLPVPPLPIRIDVFRGNSKKLDYDETLIIDCELVNETAHDVELSLGIEIKHVSRTVKHNSKYKMTVESSSRKKVDLPLIDFIEGKDVPGEYKATALLKSMDDSNVEQTKSFTFYLHEEPPEKGKAFLRHIRFLPGKNKPFERQKQLPITDKGVLYIVWDHPDFLHARNRAGSRKKAICQEILIYSVKCGIDAAVQKLFELKNNENQLDIDEIRRIKNRCDEMYYDAVVGAGTV